MRIQHNIAAMNAYRNYNINTSAVSKNLEKLSSGYRINRAGDDAAGLAISEKMRAQITGLDAATKNVKDGISLVKTAEGAMQEVQDMLNRMVNLATQSANGTYDNEVDRDNLQKEVDQLRSEINRIADSANFNGIKLLDGSLEGGQTEIAWQGSTNETGVTPILDGQLVTKDPTPGKYSIDFGDLKFSNASTDAETLTFNLTTGGGGAISITISIAAGKTLEGQDAIKAIMDALDSAKGTTATQAATAVAGDNKLQIDGITYNLSAEGNKIIFEMDSAPTKDVTTQFTASFVTSNFSSVGLIGTGVEQVQVTPEVEAVPTSGRVYGQAQLTLSDALTADGNAIKIGDETYVFARKQSTLEKFGDSKAHVIDLTDIKSTTFTTADLAKVASRVAAAAADNTRFKVGSNIGGNGILTFTEKEGGVDYDVNNLAGPDGKGTINGASGTKDATANDWKGLIVTGTAALGKPPKGTALTLQIGDTSDSFNQLKVSIGDIHTDALGISKISIATQQGAANAVDTIKNAINTVSSIRGTLGATQNRLEHTQNNLSVMAENIQDAESTIRDTDVAEEMMAYTKNNILVQSAQAMLAQANQIPQGVLQLLG